MTLREKLADAEAAYHRLQTGMSAREYVDQNGERVIYVAANRKDLAAYIRQLRADIAASGRGSGAGFPLRITF